MWVRVSCTRVRTLRTRLQTIRTQFQTIRTQFRTIRTRFRIVRTQFRIVRTRVQVFRTRVPMFCVRGVKVRARGADGSFMANYMPRGDAQFAAWAKHYVQAVSEYFQQQGLDDPMLLQLQLAYGGWVNRYAAHVAAQNAARAATENKDEARAALEDAVRPVTNFVQSYPATTDADRATIGISIRPPSGTPSSAPRTAPSATVQSLARLTHELRLVDTATPTRTKKPRGVLGAEVWVKFDEPGTGQLGIGTGDQALGISEDKRSAPSSAPVPSAQPPVPSFSFLTMTTRPSLRAEFKPGDGGKTAVYMARWVSTRGEKGPWSEVATATVAA